MNYYEKYLKYKNKYLQFIQKGGVDINIIKFSGDTKKYTFDDEDTLEVLIKNIRLTEDNNFSLIHLGEKIYDSKVIDHTNLETLLNTYEDNNIQIVLSDDYEIFKNYITTNNIDLIKNVSFYNPETVQLLVKDIFELVNDDESKLFFIIKLYSKINSEGKNVKECINKILEKYPNFIKTLKHSTEVANSDSINNKLLNDKMEILSLVKDSENLQYVSQETISKIYNEDKIDDLPKDKHIELKDQLSYDNDNGLYNIKSNDFPPEQSLMRLPRLVRSASDSD